MARNEWHGWTIATYVDAGVVVAVKDEPGGPAGRFPHRRTVQGFVGDGTLKQATERVKRDCLASDLETASDEERAEIQAALDEQAAAVDGLLSGSGE
jgi:hypothetical protein